jgi:hypothetical protein
MKRCPTCNRIENDASLAFCRADGTPLVSIPFPRPLKLVLRSLERRQPKLKRVSCLIRLTPTSVVPLVQQLCWLRRQLRSEHLMPNGGMVLFR